MARVEMVCIMDIFEDVTLTRLKFDSDSIYSLHIEFIIFKKLLYIFS